MQHHPIWLPASLYVDKFRRSAPSIAPACSWTGAQPVISLLFDSRSIWGLQAERTSAHSEAAVFASHFHLSIVPAPCNEVRCKASRRDISLTELLAFGPMPGKIFLELRLLPGHWLAYDRPLVAAGLLRNEAAFRIRVQISHRISRSLFHQFRSNCSILPPPLPQLMGSSTVP